MFKMKSLVIIISFLGAFLAEGVLLRLPFPYRIEPPIVFLILFYWLWQIEDSSLVLIVLLIALILESKSVFPPGSYVVVLLVATGILLVLKKILIHKNYIHTQGIAVGIYLLWIGLSLPAYENIFLWFHGNKDFISVFLPEIFLWAGFWALIFSLFYIIKNRYLL